MPPAQIGSTNWTVSLGGRPRIRQGEERAQYNSHCETIVFKSILLLAGSPSIRGSFSNFCANCIWVAGAAFQSRPPWDSPRGPILIRVSFKNKRFQNNYVASGVPLNPMVFQVPERIEFGWPGPASGGGRPRIRRGAHFSYDSHSKTCVQVLK